MTSADKSLTKDDIDVDVKVQAHKLTVQSLAKADLNGKGVKKDIQIPMVHNVNVEGSIGSITSYTDLNPHFFLICSHFQGHHRCRGLHRVRLLPVEERER